MDAAEDRSVLGQVRLTRARDPEVRDLQPARMVDEGVVRLEVAVDDAALVNRRRGAQDLRGEVDRVVGL